MLGLKSSSGMQLGRVQLRYRTQGLRSGGLRAKGLKGTQKGLKGLMSSPIGELMGT